MIFVERKSNAALWSLAFLGHRIAEGKAESLRILDKWKAMNTEGGSDATTIQLRLDDSITMSEFADVVDELARHGHEWIDVNGTIYGKGFPRSPRHESMTTEASGAVGQNGVRTP